MISEQIKGRVHSIQSLGTLDGPGVRFVVFLQGCNLRCGCCHNPDTWSLDGGMEQTPEEIVAKAIRFREYFGREGGITVSGGEPLLQAELVKRVFELCHAEGINTCLDTAGSVHGEAVEELLEETDRVLLDIKYATDEKYRKYVGCGIERPLRFLETLNKKKIPTTVRQVVIPTLNDALKDAEALRMLLKPFECVDKIELLPFRKICQVKYDKMGIEFPFADLPTPSAEKMLELQQSL